MRLDIPIASGEVCVQGVSLMQINIHMGELVDTICRHPMNSNHLHGTHLLRRTKADADLPTHQQYAGCSPSAQTHQDREYRKHLNA